MPVLKVKDADNSIRYLSAKGAGTELDPFIMENTESQAVSVVKSVSQIGATAGLAIWTPASGKYVDINSIIVTLAADLANDDGVAKLQIYSGGQWIDLAVLSSKQKQNQVISHTFKHHVQTDNGSGSEVIRLVVTGTGSTMHITATIEGEEL